VPDQNKATKRGKKRVATEQSVTELGKKGVTSTNLWVGKTRQNRKKNSVKKTDRQLENEKGVIKKTRVKNAGGGKRENISLGQERNE